MRARIIRPVFDRLKADALHEGSTWCSWSDAPEGSYEAWAAERCDKCGALFVFSAGEGGEGHRQIDGTDCDGYVSTFEGPAMNYFYSLPDFDGGQDAAKLIEHLPLCLIQWNADHGRDGWALTLTGGGMDLSWEICEAFMQLGYLPPLKYAGRLPNFAGKRGAAARFVLRGARKSIQVARNWLGNDARHVRQVAASIRENERRTKGAA